MLSYFVITINQSTQETVDNLNHAKAELEKNVAG